MNRIRELLLDAADLTSKELPPGLVALQIPQKRERFIRMWLEALPAAGIRIADLQAVASKRSNTPSPK